MKKFAFVMQVPILTIAAVVVVSDADAGMITLENATATFSQANFAVGKAIDDPSTVGPGAISGVPQPTGWAIRQSGNAFPQTAVFETDPTDPDLPTGPMTTLEFELDFQYEDTFWGVNSAKFNLGRFRLSATVDDRDNFANGLATGGDVTADWIVLTPIEVTSSDPATSFLILPDGSILANPLSNNVLQTYKVVANTTLTGITGFRLEALEDASLILNGPGRFPFDGNFVLTNFSVDASAVPEPTMLLSCGIGMGICILGSLRRRRARGKE